MNRRLLLALSLLVSCPAARDSSSQAPPDTRVEWYQYVSVPEDDPESRYPEITQATITTSPGSMRYEFTIERGERIERGWIETDARATFTGARRTVHEGDRGLVEYDSMWVDNDDLYVRRVRPERKRGRKDQVKDFDIPDDKPLVVDASFLLWLREFPYGSGASSKVFMVDFSQHKVTVEAVDRGVETVTVPAGTFDCHHVEVIVMVLWIKTRIDFWMSTSAPHFLVRHQGKRGPFTDSYVTELVKLEHN